MPTSGSAGARREAERELIPRLRSPSTCGVTPRTSTLPTHQDILMQSERLTRAIRSTATALVLAALAGCAHLPDQPAYAPADLPRCATTATGSTPPVSDASTSCVRCTTPAIRRCHRQPWLYGRDTRVLRRPARRARLPAVGRRKRAGDRHGNTALMGALFKNEPDIARRLIDTPCPIDQTNGAGETALGFATLFNRFDLIPLLVARGANPNHVDRRGRRCCSSRGRTTTRKPWTRCSRCAAVASCPAS